MLNAHRLGISRRNQANWTRACLGYYRQDHSNQGDTEYCTRLPDSYADNWQKPLEFSVGDKRSKISLRYVRPFEIIKRVGPVAYRLRLSQELVGIHDMFHVSNQNKCMVDVNLHVLLEEIKIENGLHFVEEPIEIMDRDVKKLKQSSDPDLNEAKIFDLEGYGNKN
ncbi:hypothetical protein Tco_1339286 [Tanacetum coccineum]